MIYLKSLKEYIFGDGKLFFNLDEIRYFYSPSTSILKIVNDSCTYHKEKLKHPLIIDHNNSPHNTEHVDKDHLKNLKKIKENPTQSVSTPEKAPVYNQDGNRLYRMAKVYPFGVAFMSDYCDDFVPVNVDE